MKITLIGTGTSQGVPVIGCKCKVCQSDSLKDKRLRTSAVIEWNNHRLVIDTGPDFRTQMLREKIDNIDAILYTHEHADHTTGLDDIRPLYFKTGVPIPIYGLSRTLNDLKIRFNYIFTRENRYPGAPEVLCNPVNPGQQFQINDLNIIPLDILHGDLPILGYKLDNFAYLTDVKKIPANTIKELKNIDLMIINALHQRPHKMHLNLPEALELIEIIQPKRAVLTHISHHMDVHEEISKKLPNNVFLGFDGMKLNV